MDKILIMFQLQNELNNSTNGDDWTNGVTKNSKTINWKRCIYMECAEMVDSFSWKHWKNIEAEPDWANMQIEVVDVWHFIMSLAIENYAQNLKGGVEDVAMDVYNFPDFVKIDTDSSSFSKPEDVMLKVENIIRITLSLNDFDLQKLIGEFFDLVVMSGLNLESLYKLYIGKNVLNQFRQDNGYKEGSYIKVWDGDEDNVVMQRVFKEEPDIKPEALYKELTKLYHELNK